MALTVRYTDNIMKNFATSAAIIITAALSFVLLHDTEVDTNFIAGTTIVVCSILLYNEQLQPPIDNQRQQREQADEKISTTT